MSALTSFLLLSTLSLAGIPQVSVSRGLPNGSAEIPLATFADASLPSGIGPANRDADHATVAMNDRRDFVVAFHTSRNDITGFGNMKQVEIAYFEHQSNDTWIHVDTILVGSIDHNPIQFLPQNTVKCERPDVIAVGNMFFVTWTRRYNGIVSGDPKEPAVLECAWIEKNAQGIQVYDHPSGNPSLGYTLAAHVPGGQASDLFHVQECAGVPDAVALIDPNDPFKVAVVYPHQTIFSTPQNLNRRFAQRLVTCSFDASSSTISSSSPTDIQPVVLFNGPSAPFGGSSAGLILPNLAPSSEANAFWLVAEAQTMTLGANPMPNGRIRLETGRKSEACGHPRQARLSRVPPEPRPSCADAR